MKEWGKAQKWEKEWHGDCANSFNEEAKQYIYASKMGLDSYSTNWYGRRGWDFGDQSVLDVGCGAYSLLLKSTAKERVVVDPCDYPDWVKARYKECGIEFLQIPAEEMKFENKFDITLIYNCLQHVQDPQKIIKKIRSYTKEIHIFEWIDTGTSDGHLHNLTEKVLNNWLGGEGKVEELNQYPCVGRVYYGIFI